jgi:hypothetical protein
MSIEEQINELNMADNDWLRSILFESSIILENVILSNPDYSEDTGYEPFGEGWLKRYFKSILSDVSNKATDDALSWALGASLYEVAVKLIDHYSLGATEYPAAIALAILLVRAAIKEKKQ